jgi:hypothetical protein
MMMRVVHLKKTLIIIFFKCKIILKEFHKLLLFEFHIVLISFDILSKIIEKLMQF